MTVGAVLLGLAILLLVLAYLVRPLVWDSQMGQPRLSREQSSLLAERERVLSLLEELEMDREMAKLSAEDYQAERAQWLQVGAGILRRLDEMGVQADPLPDQPAAQAESVLEAQVQAMRHRLESAPDSRFCPACGAPVDAGDAYCTACGTALARRADT